MSSITVRSDACHSITLLQCVLRCSLCVVPNLSPQSAGVGAGGSEHELLPRVDGVQSFGPCSQSPIRSLGWLPAWGLGSSPSPPNPRPQPAACTAERGAPGAVELPGAGRGEGCASGEMEGRCTTGAASRDEARGRATGGAAQVRRKEVALRAASLDTRAPKKVDWTYQIMFPSPEYV